MKKKDAVQLAQVAAPIYGALLLEAIQPMKAEPVFISDVDRRTLAQKALHCAGVLVEEAEQL